jgi:lycopene beta-cyclase
MGNNTYLFESTYYTSLKKEQSEMTKEINKYIKENYQINYSVIREEYGEIPLTTNIRINNKNSKLTNIGIPAGSTRASTGYTFLNIQKQADEYIKKLAGEDYKEYSRTFKNVILRKMDNILLMIIKDRPVYSKSILFRLFERNEDNRIIRFLSDAPSIIDILIIIWNMPKIIFIKYAIKSLTARNL